MDYQGQSEWDKPLAAAIAIGAGILILSGLIYQACKSDEPKKEAPAEPAKEDDKG